MRQLFSDLHAVSWPDCSADDAHFGQSGRGGARAAHAGGGQASRKGPSHDSTAAASSWWEIFAFTAFATPLALGWEQLEDRRLLAGIEDPAVVVTPPPLALTAVGVPFIDPIFGMTLRHVSDSSDRGEIETQVDSLRQAFSCDNGW